jgi:hypothetical protein
MKTTVKALLELYEKLGGSLDDTYEGIADGAAVGNYTNIPDCISACAQKAGSGGGGDPIDYNELANRPVINNEYLIGGYNTSESLNICSNVELYLDADTGVISSNKRFVEVANALSRMPQNFDLFERLEYEYRGKVIITSIINNNGTYTVTALHGTTFYTGNGDEMEQVTLTPVTQ